MLDLRLIRVTLAELTIPLGWQAWSYAPSDPASLPCAVAGVPTEINYQTTMKHSSVTLPLSLYTNAAYLDDAQLRLDAALSRGVVGSIVDVLMAARVEAWKLLRIASASPVRYVPVGDSGHALATDLSLIIDS